MCLWRNNRTALILRYATFSFASLMDLETERNICYTNVLPVEMLLEVYPGLSSSDLTHNGLNTCTYGATASDSSYANNALLK